MLGVATIAHWQLLRAEVNVLETLFSMGRPHVTLLEDPKVCVVVIFLFASITVFSRCRL